MSLSRSFQDFEKSVSELVSAVRRKHGSHDQSTHGHGGGGGTRSFAKTEDAQIAKSVTDLDRSTRMEATGDSKRAASLFNKGVADLEDRIYYDKKDITSQQAKTLKSIRDSNSVRRMSSSYDTVADSVDSLSTILSDYGVK